MKWSVNVKYWRNVLLREQRSERRHNWGERESEGEMVINLVNVVTGSSICSS